jgi:hydroxymethylpyrimidine/phosphomethylpyrimidine kinase
MVREQIEVLVKNFRIAAIKTGLLCSAEIISTVAQTLLELSAKSKKRFPLVIDPVIVATSGDQLLRPAAIEVYKRKLFPLGMLITPNLDEATRLLGKPVCDLQAMREAAKKLQRKYGVSILLKGGHLTGSDAIDVLFHRGKLTAFSAPFIRNIATHGTGCTYSAAITAGLASGLQLKSAIERAKKFVTNSIAHRLRWKSRLGKNLDALSHSI